MGDVAKSMAGNAYLPPTSPDEYVEPFGLPSLFDSLVLIPFAFFVWAWTETVPEYIHHAYEQAVAIYTSDPSFRWEHLGDSVFCADQALRWIMLGLMGILVTTTLTVWASRNAARLQRTYQRFCRLCIGALVVHIVARLCAYSCAVRLFVLDGQYVITLLATCIIVLPITRYRIGYVTIVARLWGRVRKLIAPFDPQRRDLTN